MQDGPRFQRCPHPLLTAPSVHKDALLVQILCLLKFFLPYCSVLFRTWHRPFFPFFFFFSPWPLRVFLQTATSAKCRLNSPARIFLYIFRCFFKGTLFAFLQTCVIYRWKFGKLFFIVSLLCFFTQDYFWWTRKTWFILLLSHTQREVLFYPGRIWDSSWRSFREKP